MYRKTERLRCMLFAIAATCAVAAPVESSFIVHSDDLFAWQISDSVPVGTGAEDLVGVVLSILNNTASAANNPQAVDLRLGGFAGVTGRLHQQRSPIDGIDTPTTGTIYSTVIDSHFLFDSITAPPGGEPIEDYDVSASIEPSDAPTPQSAQTSFGTFLGFTGTQVGTVGPEWDLAYLVVPNGTVIRVSADVANGRGDSRASNFDFTIPEPSTAALAMTGLIFALSRYRQSVRSWPGSLSHGGTP